MYFNGKRQNPRTRKQRDILRKMLEMKTTDRIEESLLWAYQLDIAEKSND